MQLTCLVSFILLLPVLVLPEVIPPQIAADTPFVKCTEFFAKPRRIITFPTIFRQDQYKQICQKYKNNYEFATLYNTEHKIPVYSAYRFHSIRNYYGQETWKIEPQLEDLSEFRQYPNMAFTRFLRRRMVIHQAKNENYKNSQIYEKGHLYPVSHTSTQDSKEATYTLTNAAPQSRSLNRGKWHTQVEKVTKNFILEKCDLNFAYVVTGVVPGTEKLNNRVIIPSFFWSAYCCLDKSMQPTHSAGFISPNTKVLSIEKITVEQLDCELSQHYNTKFSVFNDRCRRKNSRNEEVLLTSSPKLSMIQNRIVNNSSLSQDQVQQRRESEMRSNSSSELGSQVRVWRNTNSILDHKSDL